MNACYFYNRIDNNKFRMVSYHFEQEAELLIEDQDIGESLKLFNPE